MLCDIDWYSDYSVHCSTDLFPVIAFYIVLFIDMTFVFIEMCVYIVCYFSSNEMTV